MTTRRAQIARSLRDKEYREGFVAAQVNRRLAFQIRATREARGWSQGELAERAGMQQARISVLENPNYGKFTLATLLRLAAAFDVGLQMRFVPFGELVDVAADAFESVTGENFAIPAFEDDARTRTLEGHWSLEEVRGT